MARKIPLRLPGALLFASAVLYMLVNTFVLPAADARYQHWSNVVFVLTVIFLVLDVSKKGDWRSASVLRTVDSP